MSRAVWWLVLIVLLGACRHAPPRPAVDDGTEGGGDIAVQLSAQSAREAGLAAAGGWRMSGRLAVSAGGDGGSGRVVWVQRGDDYEITLSAPVTRRSWVLAKAGDRVRLSGLDGGDREGSDAEALLAEATGWRLPVQALAAWARGARAAGPAQIEFAADGLPSRIGQFGWEVDYREWNAAAPGDGAPSLPRRVFARQGDASVRLVVERWDPLP